MNTKICTSIKQSKKLIKLGIDINSADMWYQHIGYSITDGKEKPTYFLMVIRDNLSDDDIPAWSLSALMNLLPSEFTEVSKYSKTIYEIKIRKYNLIEDVNLHQIAYGNYKFYEDGNSYWKDMINTGEKEELLDAAFEMVCWLKENNKI